MLKFFPLQLIIISLVHLFVIIFTAIHYKRYDPGKLSISRLGTKKSPYHKILNLSGFIFGISVYVFGLGLDSISSYASIFVILIGSILSISAFFPYDKFPKIHDSIAGLLGIACVSFSVSIIKYVKTETWLPDILISVILGIVLSSGMLVFELSHKVSKQSYPKYTWYWEWGWLGFELLFIFIICISILKLN